MAATSTQKQFKNFERGEEGYQNISSERNYKNDIKNCYIFLGMQFCTKLCGHFLNKPKICDFLYISFLTYLKTVVSSSLCE